MSPLQGGPDGDGAAAVADALGDVDRADFSEAGEDFLLREDGLEELDVLVEDVAGLVEDDEAEAGLVDQGLGLHFSQVVDDLAAPGGAVAAVAEAALAKLEGDFDFKPKGSFGAAGVRRSDE